MSALHSASMMFFVGTNLLEKTCPQAWLCLDAGSRTGWCWIGSTCKNLRATEICGSCFYLGVFHDACLGTSTKAGFICWICILARHWSFHNGHILYLLRIPCTLPLHWLKSRNLPGHLLTLRGISHLILIFWQKLSLTWLISLPGMMMALLRSMMQLGTGGLMPEKSTCQCHQCHGHAQCQHEKW